MEDDGGDVSHSINHDLRLMGETGDDEDGRGDLGSSAAVTIDLAVAMAREAQKLLLLSRLLMVPAITRGPTPQKCGLTLSLCTRLRMTSG
jgi:hypothetical protein